jgi:hypothetical protein
MHVAVLGAGFAVGIAAFVAWLGVMLRQDRAHRLALIAATHEQTRGHRRAALAARREPEPVVTTRHVVRPGSFCRVPGSVGLSKRGATLVCEASTHGRPRWRKIVARVAA